MNIFYENIHFPLRNFFNLQNRFALNKDEAETFLIKKFVGKRFLISQIGAREDESLSYLGLGLYVKHVSTVPLNVSH